MDQLEITSRFRICNKMKSNEIEHLFSKMTNSPRDEAARPSKAGQPKNHSGELQEILRFLQ